jgi:hypothetical protein
LSKKTGFSCATDLRCISKECIKFIYYLPISLNIAISSGSVQKQLLEKCKRKIGTNYCYSKKAVKVHEISGSDGAEEVGVCPLGCNAL